MVSNEAKIFNKNLPSYQKNEELYYNDPAIELIISSIHDSVFTKNGVTRPFYFYLMNQNILLADGSLMLSSILNQYKVIENQPSLFFNYMNDNPTEKNKYFVKWAKGMNSFSDQYCATNLNIDLDTCLQRLRKRVMYLMAGEKQSILKVAADFFKLMNTPDNLPSSFIIAKDDNNKTIR